MILCGESTTRFKDEDIYEDNLIMMLTLGLNRNSVHFGVAAECHNHITRIRNIPL